MRYFFHLHNDIDTHDEEGRELAGIDVARAHALTEARVMASESVEQGHLNLNHYVAVEDDAGELQFNITFGEAVAVIARDN